MSLIRFSGGGIGRAECNRDFLGRGKLLGLGFGEGSDLGGDGDGGADLFLEDFAAVAEKTRAGVHPLELL